LPENCMEYEAPFPSNLRASRSGSPQLTTNVCEAFHSNCRNTFTVLTPTSIFLVELKECQTIIYAKWPSVNLSATVAKKCHV
jgi:hypothetical protein